MTATISFFRNATDFESFSAGQIIFQEGQPGEVMYAVTEGEVDIIVHNIDTQPRSATAIAKTDCKLVPISEKRFTFLVQQTPNFALQVMRVLAYRLRHMDAQV
jgi:CRP/FNR family transcriptional regulator, cyclic AMP receptor protein